MLRKITLAVALVAFMAAPAFAAVQNVKVSGNINSTYLYRDAFDFGAGAAGSDYDQKVFITQSTLRVDADLSDNVQTVLQLINEREWGSLDHSSSANNDDNVNINLAYVRMKELLYSPLTVEIGRMQLNYGNGFIIGNGTNNTTYGNNPLSTVARDLANNTAFDTIRAILDYKPLTVDIFGTKIHANNTRGLSASVGQDDDVDLFGINANYQLGDDMDSVVEAYLFAQFDRSVNTAAGDKTDKIYVPGLRASTNPISGLNVQGEVAWQKGTLANTAAGDNIQRDAFGFQGIVNYQVKQEDVEKYKPVLQGVYTFVSGDSNPTDVLYSSQASSNKFTGWSPMYEGQGGGKIYNALYNLTDSHIVELSTAFNPIEDVTAKFSWTGLWLDKSLDRQVGGPQAGNGTIAASSLPDGNTVAKNVSSNLSLGNEFDAVFTYNYTEDVQFGLNMGWFFPGSAYDPAGLLTSNNDVAKQAIANVSVNF